MAGKFYIYEHWRPDLDICFYVGLGQGRRANVMYARNRRHTAVQDALAIQGMCVEVRLVSENLDADTAKEYEISQISFWRERGVKLTNLTAGGDGSLNPEPETREKMSAAKKGRKLPEAHKAKIAAATKIALNAPGMREKIGAAIRVAKSTPEAKAKASANSKKMVRTKEHYEKVAAALRGKKLSPEHVEKVRAANTGRKQSQESIEKRRAANKGAKRSPEFCAHMKAVWTPERRAAFAEYQRQKAASEPRKRKPPTSPEIQAKIRAAAQANWDAARAGWASLTDEQKKIIGSVHKYRSLVNK